VKIHDESLKEKTFIQSKVFDYMQLFQSDEYSQKGKKNTEGHQKDFSQ